MKIKEQILELLNKHKFYVDNHNDAIFSGSFESLTEDLEKLFDTTIITKIQESIKEMKSLKEQLALTEAILKQRYGEFAPNHAEYKDEMRKQFKIIK